MRVRGGSGLGDSIYQRPIVEYLIARGEQVTVCSDWPEVFDGTGATVEPFGRERIDVLAHYTAGKANPHTNQWQDVCASAKISEIALRFDWPVRNRTLIDRLRILADNKPLILVHGGRTPMARTDGFGKELLPRKEAFAAVLGALYDCFLVQIGQAAQVYPLACDLSLNGSTSVSDLLDLGAACDGVVGQCSFAIPLAEVFDKPALFVWAAWGMEATRHQYVRQITPSKILSKASSGYVVDDWSAEDIVQATRAFRSLLASPESVAA